MRGLGSGFGEERWSAEGRQVGEAWSVAIGCFWGGKRNDGFCEGRRR